MAHAEGGPVVFYIALLFLILLVAAALILLVQNFTILLSGVHLTFFSWHLPGIPVFLLFLLGAFMGGLLLYVFSTRSAHNDAREIKRLNARVKELRAQIEELEREKSQVRLGGAPSANFAPPAVPMPGFASSGPMGPTGPLGQRQPSPPGPLQNLPPSSSGLSNLSLPPRPLPQLPQNGAPRPPFPPS